jgi:hypothetical protein
MALLIPSMIFPFVGIWGLKTLSYHRNVVEKKRLNEQFLFSVGITGVICLIFLLLSGKFYDFRSPGDAQFISQVPAWYYSALLADRESMLKEDALRSFFFILLSATCLFFYVNKRKKQLNYSFILLIVLLLVDLFTVNKRYLNDSVLTNNPQTKIHIYLFIFSSLITVLSGILIHSSLKQKQRLYFINNFKKS